MSCGNEESRYAPEKIRDMIACHAGSDRVPKKLNIIGDTTDFFRVNYDDVLILGGVPYFVRNYEREGRFGIDDEPKFWVRRATNLLNGKRYILKLVFLEKFRARVGDLVFECARSPRKEARILELVSDHPNFMHGFGVKDSANNMIRVLEFIPGKTLAGHVADFRMSHEEYFHTHFPSLFGDFIELTGALKFIHDFGEKHGDIRRDHAILDKESGRFRWIDFDFNYLHKENMFGYDLFGLGNILVYIAGHGDITVQELKKDRPSVFNCLTDEDMNIIFHNRVVNLKKVFPYLPKALNLILLHFSSGASIFYETTGQLIADLLEAKEELMQLTGRRNDED